MSLKDHPVETRAKIYTILSMLAVFILGVVSVFVPEIFFALLVLIVAGTVLTVVLMIIYELIYESYKEWLNDRDGV